MGLDLVIRGGTIVDGSGAARYRGDVGIADGRIVEIGRIRSLAPRTLDADGLIVAPGFIDGHTHMDAQVSWDRIGSCSCWHGVTSVIMGNCGFALAPCKPEEREWFARCLTAVEDIPTEAMLAGIDWTWESFPEYLATVDRLPKAINYGAYIGHSALRMYVMGKRALSEKATEADLARMSAAVTEAMRAGAMGFSSSRATTHVTPDDTPVASRIADWSEVDRLVGAMADLNAGIFQVGPDTSGGQAQRAFFARLKQVAVESGRPVMFGTISSRQGKDPNPWTYQLDYLDECAAAGARMWGQTTTRSINAIFSLKSYLPFDVLPTWRQVRALPLDEQKRRLADPATRRQLVAEEAGMKPRGDVFQGGGAATTDPRKPDYDNLYAMQGVDWNDPTVARLAAQRGRHPVETMIDLVLENDNQVFVQPLVNEHPDHVLGMLKHPRTLATFSDSGAHVCQEMGSSLQTHLLSYWVRARQAFTLEEAVRKLTFDNASAWELNDRGLVRTGYRADLVVFDEARVKPAMPTVETDLPGGARRLVQKAEGIAATIVNGQVTLEDGKATGSMPASCSAAPARGWRPRGRADRGMGAAPPVRTSDGNSRAGAMDPAIHGLREFFRGRTDVRLAVVFGSRARGTAVEASDVDVAVHAPGVDLLGLAADVSRVTRHEVDVVALDDAGVPLLARIVREGVGVHEARPGALAAWRAHALADLETDRPWFARMRDAWLARVAARGV